MGPVSRDGAAFLVLLLAVLLSVAPLRAQENGPLPGAVTPPETREIVAEGQAAVGTGGVPAAREAAIAQALRGAVEQATGIFVSARTLTHNFRQLQDEITTRAEGFATLKEVLRERLVGGEMRVTVRALVSLRPLARRLKALKLTRAWRVRVDAGAQAEAARAPLEQALTDAGFVVVAPDGAAEVVVRVAPVFTRVAETALDTAAGPMTMHSIRARVSLRATRGGTGEVVCAFSGSDVAAHVARDTAQNAALTTVLDSLAPRLTDALLLLPAQESQPVTLVVAALDRIATVGKLHEALHTLPGVRGVTRRSWENNTATWELDVTTDAVPLLARALEEDAATRPFRLRVTAETRDRIAASAARAIRAGTADKTTQP